MIAFVAFLMIVLIVALLLKGKRSPIVVLTVIPTVAALILGYGPAEVAGFIKDGIATTTSNGILFILAGAFHAVEGYLKDVPQIGLRPNGLLQDTKNLMPSLQEKRRAAIVFHLQTLV